jgi:hypothetical protein
MDISNKTVLVLGGWGLVGSAICRKLMPFTPKRIIVTSLLKSEALDAVAQLRDEFPKMRKNFFVPAWGNIFVRDEFKDLNREEILADHKNRMKFVEDIIEELSPEILERSVLFQLLQKYRPDIVVDCINSATVIAYQDIFQASRSVVRMLHETEKTKKTADALLEETERLLCTLYMPQLIRHVQILYRSMNSAGTKIFIKIGTSGTGGMGLNIPYTHSEGRPSSVLLSKSAVAGAHTLLLFLMGRTPDAPITKEIKPTAAIAWKKIGFGEVRRRGKPIPLVDCPVEHGVILKGTLKLKMENAGLPVNETLKSVFIDTGENGIFSRGEFEAISTPGQMEFVTPEEIAEDVLFEIRGGNTGHDIINALDNATLEPTYRAGFLFNSAMNRMKQLEKEHSVSSIAFEILGPPRLSKLLHEANLLRIGYSDVKSVLQTDARNLSAKLSEIIQRNSDLRTQIISIGIPILMPDGKTLLRGNDIKVPSRQRQDENELKITSGVIDRWAHDGWVDLRTENMNTWKKRLSTIVNEVSNLAESDTSSRFMRTPEYWDRFESIDPGKIVGWIFTEEEKGLRMKA